MFFYNGLIAHSSGISTEIQMKMLINQLRESSSPPQGVRQLGQRNVLWRAKQAGEKVSQHSQAQLGPTTTAFAQLHPPQSQPMFEPFPERLDRAVIGPDTQRFARAQGTRRTDHAESLRARMGKQHDDDL